MHHVSKLRALLVRFSADNLINKVLEFILKSLHHFIFRELYVFISSMDIKCSVFLKATLSPILFAEKFRQQAEVNKRPPPPAPTAAIYDVHAITNKMFNNVIYSLSLLIY